MKRDFDLILVNFIKFDLWIPENVVLELKDFIHQSRRIHDRVF